jgi:hypothetical protein
MRQIDVGVDETSDQIVNKLLNTHMSVYVKVNDKIWHPKATATEMKIQKDDIIRVHYRGLGGMMAPSTKKSEYGETDSPD